MPHIKVCNATTQNLSSSHNFSNHILQKHVFEYETIKPFDTNISIIFKAKNLIFYLYIGLVTKHIFRSTEFE